MDRCPAVDQIALNLRRPRVPATLSRGPRRWFGYVWWLNSPVLTKLRMEVLLETRELPGLYLAALPL